MGAEHRKPLVLLILGLMTSLSACASTQRAAQDGAVETASEYYEKSESDAPLQDAYDEIVFCKFTTTEQLEVENPYMLIDCQHAAMAFLNHSKAYPNVVEEKPGAEYKGKALLVRVHIPHVRLVNSAARAWGGAFAGSSEMQLDVRLVDAGSGEVVRERQLDTHNNSFAAAYSGGFSDRTLPSDMGIILAGYIMAVVPCKGTQPPQ